MDREDYKYLRDKVDKIHDVVMANNNKIAVMEAEKKTAIRLTSTFWGMLAGALPSIVAYIYRKFH